MNVDLSVLPADAAPGNRDRVQTVLWSRIEAWSADVRPQVAVTGWLGVRPAFASTWMNGVPGGPCRPAQASAPQVSSGGACSAESAPKRGSPGRSMNTKK